jgi:hypothetical protein
MLTNDHLVDDLELVLDTFMDYAGSMKDSSTLREGALKDQYIQLVKNLKHKLSMVGAHGAFTSLDDRDYFKKILAKLLKMSKELFESVMTSSTQETALKLFYNTVDIINKGIRAINKLWPRERKIREVDPDQQLAFSAVQ